MFTTAVVYKWRITNAKYIYLTDEDKDNPEPEPFIYDINDGTRKYLDPNHKEYDSKVDEIMIKEIVSSFDDGTYENAFDKMSGLLKSDKDGFYLHLLDSSAYRKDIPECVEGATDVTCNPIDLMFTADAYLLPSDEKAKAEIDPVEDIQLPNGSRQRTFHIDFGIPAAKNGINGKDGKSAYVIACENGFTGTTEEEWLDSLQGEKGPQGDKGDTGKSAYEIAGAQGFIGTEREWVLSLKGDKGDDGTIGINKVQKEIIYNILGYNPNDSNGNISYFPYVYNKFITKPKEGESESEDITFYLSSADKDEYKRTYHLQVKFGSGETADCVVNPINGYTGLCLRYNDKSYDRRMNFCSEGAVIYTAIESYSFTKSSFDELYKIYEKTKNGEYEKDTTIENYGEDGVDIYLLNPNGYISESKIFEFSVNVEKTTLTNTKNDFIVDKFDKISIQPESELNSNILLKSVDGANTTIKSSDITQNLDDTSIQHYILTSEEGANVEYESTMQFKAKLLNIELLKNKDTVCDITISNDNFESTDRFKVTSKLATFKPEVKAKVNEINDVYLGVPIGTIVMWPLENPPKGWLICDGMSYNGNDQRYSKLYNVIKRQYTADSILKPWFQVPDLVQKFPLGAANSDPYKLGATGGTEKVALTEKEMPQHNHQLKEILSSKSAGSGWAGVNFNGGGSGKMEDFVSPNNVYPTTTTVGEGEAHNNMPPYLTLNFIIKYM